jgi:hypothetical protein
MSERPPFMGPRYRYTVARVRGTRSGVVYRTNDLREAIQHACVHQGLGATIVTIKDEDNDQVVAAWQRVV